MVDDSHACFHSCLYHVHDWQTRGYRMLPPDPVSIHKHTRQYAGRMGRDLLAACGL
jgi:hypothetical protein